MKRAKRPDLSKPLDASLFLQYYYLKDERVSFCKINDLSTLGGKPEITERIAHFLESGEKLPHVKAKSFSQLSVPVLDFILEEGRKFDEVRREFFVQHMVSSFHFNVKFQKWLTENAGDKTYRDAIHAYSELLSKKHRPKSASSLNITLISEIFLRIVKLNP